VHAESSETGLVGPLLDRLRDRAGRLVFNGWPTGVSVTPAMHHGGPYPATTAPLHTSVGATAIRRFLRPVCYQSMPQGLLPPALRDHNELGIPRRINGRLTTAPVPSEETQ
jgi:NADP-dependent aldehyde dehydrogenase